MSDICIKVFATRGEAEIAKGFLLDEDIESSIVTDDAGGSFSPVCGSFCLLVRKEDKERALHILHSQSGQGYKKPPG